MKFRATQEAKLEGLRFQTEGIEVSLTFYEAFDLMSILYV